MTIWTIVVAAGSGTRFGGAKQFAALGDATVVDRAVAGSRHVSDGVVVVVPPDTAWTGAADEVVPGGETRAESVRCGLASVPPDASIILIHDGARPLASPRLYLAVIAAVRAGADAAIPGLAVSDTLKRIDSKSRVVTTVDRSGLIAVQTPQAFSAAALRSAHAAGDDADGQGAKRAIIRDATDDAALVEAAGGTVVVVPGDTSNIKLTHPDDLRIVAALLGMR